MRALSNVRNFAPLVREMLATSRVLRAFLRAFAPLSAAVHATCALTSIDESFLSMDGAGDEESSDRFSIAGAENEAAMEHTSGGSMLRVCTTLEGGCVLRPNLPLLKSDLF